MSPDIESIRRNNMRQLADTGAFRVQAIKAKSAVESYTQALQKQDVVFRGWRKNAELRNDVLREQYRLQRMSVMGWKEDGMGRISADMIVPRDVPARLGNFRAGLADVRAGQASLGTVLDETRMRMGLWSQGVSSASKNLVNWGKNTQWAGRQMMVGLTLPFAALAAGTGVLAYQLDKEMTRVLKVYDYATTSIEAEGERLRESTMATARSVANMYGQSAQDTIGIIAELAAAGRTGKDLQDTAKLVSRASMLGELDRQDAIKTTISLQEVFKQSNEELTVSFDYLNALENSTTLSMRDMTVAIPKLSGVVKSLGGDYKTMGTMMAAAKAAGLDAPEAANMLKTAMFRAVSPYGKGKETFFEKTNIDLTKLVATTKGEAIPTFQAIGQAMEGLSNIDRNAVLKDLFGVYQGSKAGQFVEQMINLKDVSTAAGKAAQVAMMSNEELAEVSAREVAKQAASASGKFKIALESIKVELADIGEPFLKVATTIIKGVTKIFSAFNSLSDTKKQVILFGLAFLAIIGPIVMITGVMATLIGTIIKFGAAMIMMSTRFKATNADQMSAALLAKGSTAAFRDQATAAQLLSYQLAKMNAQLSTAGRLNTNAAIASAGAAAGARTQSMYQSTAGRSMVTNDQGRKVRANQGDISRHRDMSHSQALLMNQQRDLDKMNGVARVGDEANKAKRSIAGMNGGLAASAGMMLMLAGGTNKWAFYLGIALMALPLILSALRGIAATAAFTSMIGGVKRVGTAISGRVGLSGRVSSLGKGLAGLAPMLGPLGLALAAAGIAFGVFYYKLKKAREEMAGLVKSGDTLTEVMGGTVLKPGQYIKGDGEVADTELGMVNKFKEANKSGAKALKELGAAATDTQGKLALELEIKRIGLQVFDATKDAKMAKQAIQVALAAAGNPSVNIDLNFDDEKAIGEAREAITQALITASSENKGSWYDPGMANEVQERLKGEAKRIAAAFGDFQSGSIDAEAFKAELDRVGGQWNAKGVEIFEKFATSVSEEEKKIFKDFGVDPNSTAAMVQGLVTNTKLRDKFMGSMGDPGNNVRSAINEMDNLIRAYEYLSTQTVDSTDTTNADGVSKRDLTTISAVLGKTSRVAADGIAATGTAADGSAIDMESLSGSMMSAEDATKQLVDAQKSLMQGAWGTVLDNASDQIESRHDNAIEAMENSSKKRLEAMDAQSKVKDKEFERRNDELDTRQKAEDRTFTSAWDSRTKSVEKSYDDRVKAIEATMAAEEKAEEQRQKMFEAEKNRIQRLSELYNQNVDFNVALNSGDMDEAAKIANGMQASQSQWALDDAAATSTDSASATAERRQGEIENINTAKTARMEQLKEEEDAAKLSLQTRQDREKKALEDEKNRYTESVEARRQAEEKKTAAAVSGSNKRYEAAKKALDAEMAALRAFIPRNEEELRAYIGRIETNYKKHGFGLDTTSKAWSASVAGAMTNATAVARTELGNEARWSSMGEAIGDDIARGMLGMSFNQFMTWMTTGEIPTEPKATAATNAGNGSRGTAYNNQQTSIGQGRHSGGPIGTSDSSRAGRPLSAGLYSDEVPIIAQKGEFMMQRSAVDRIGLNNLAALNQGKMGPDKTGRMHNGGIVGGIGAMFQGAMQKGIAATMAMGAQRKAQELAAEGKYANIPAALQGAMGSGYAAGAAGKYGNSTFDVSQLQNAATIAGVGRGMGASDRDIKIALMTALQESGLRNLNYGDRDSVGLFQQRTSQGWGTVEQIMNPSYSAGKFFEGLLKIEERGGMSLAQAAQSVQRSAYPDAYAKWEDEAAGILSGGIIQNAPAFGMLPPGVTASSPSGEDGFASHLTALQRQVNPGVLQKVWQGLAMVPGRQQITSGLRPGSIVAGSSGRMSLHSRGQAADIGALARKDGGTAESEAMGDRIAAVFRSGMIPGVSEVLWKTMQGGNHFNHVHVGFRHKGGEIDGQPGPVYDHELPGRNNQFDIPGLKVGGEVRYDNTIANLHRDETVLTAPLSKQLREGINNIDGGAGNEYNITMDFRGAVIREDVDIEKAVAKVLQAQESKMGRKRTIR